MQAEIRFAAEQDIPGLCSVWKACFPDSEDYIEYFYRENFRRISVPVCVLDGKPVSMLHLMDAVFADGPDRYPVRFVYAAGTLPACRNNGYMRSLLETVTRTAERHGYGLFLKPSPPLTDFYAARGFIPDSRFRIFTAKPEPDERKELSFAPLSAEEYNRQRNDFFAGRPFVEWPDAHIRWCVDENAFCGGQTLSVLLEGKTYFLMGCPAGSVLRVTETSLSPGQLRSAVSALCGHFGTDRLEAFMPEEYCEQGNTVISSAVFRAPMRHTYANLLLI